MDRALGAANASNAIAHAFVLNFRSDFPALKTIQEANGQLPMIVEYSDTGRTIVRELISGSLTYNDQCAYIYLTRLTGSAPLPAGFAELEQQVQVDFSVAQSPEPQPTPVAFEPTIEVPARSIVVTIANEAGTPIGGTCLMGIPAVFGFVCDNADEANADTRHALPDLDPDEGVIQIGYWNSGMDTPPTYEVLPPDGYVVINPEGRVFEVTPLGVSEYYFHVVLAPSIPA